MITEQYLNDLRARVLQHEKDIAAGKADPAQPPYTIEELRTALRAISLDRERIATEAKPKRAASKTVDLSDLL